MILDSENLKAWVEVDAAALRHNLTAMAKNLGKNVSVIAVVKSNAYGHGIELCAKAFSEMPQVTYLGVDTIEEALQLKKAGIKKPILILGYVPPGMFGEVVRNGFLIAVYNFGSLKILDTIAGRMHKKAFVHFKIETGTFRQGIMPEDWQKFAVYTAKHPSVTVDGIYTHFSDTENAKSTYYKHQLKNFSNALAVFDEQGIKPRLVHASSTAASMIYPEAYFNAVRLGIGMYGMYPAPEVARVSHVKLRPALCWKTRIAQVKKIKKGDMVGYDRTYKAHSSRTIAILPVGYWDGYDRGFSNAGIVLVRGKRCPVIGRICMNMCMIDVTRVRTVRPGYEVALLGRQGKESVSAEDLADCIGTINYEITTRINPLMKRICV